MTMLGEFVLALLEAALVEVLSRVTLDGRDPSARRAFVALRSFGYGYVLVPSGPYEAPPPDVVPPVNTRYTPGYQ